MNVFLIGFMGSGKSKLGKRLAGSLNLDYVDLDDEIEKREGRSITEIFASDGEASFRLIEQKVLFDFYADKNVVISLGGGTCCNDSSWKFLEENGLIIYLKEPEEVLYGRLKTARAGRPLIANLNDEELRTFISKKLEERSAYYEKAHFIFEKEKSTYGFLVKQIETYLK